MYALKDESGNPGVIYKWNPSGAANDHYDLTRTFKDDFKNPVLFISRSDASEKLSSIYFNVDRVATDDADFPFYLYILKGRRE